MESRDRGAHPPCLRQLETVSFKDSIDFSFAMEPTHDLDEQNQILLEKLRGGDASAKADIVELNRAWAIELAHSLAPDVVNRDGVERAALRRLETAAATSLHSGKHFAPFNTKTDGFATWYVRLEVLRYAKSDGAKSDGAKSDGAKSDGAEPSPG